ncbi:MAG: secondary thiamine-phosphate synthase enzyme YjbQ [Hyphomicrobiales bacterium]
MEQRLRVATASRTHFVPLAGRIRSEAGALLGQDGLLVASVPHTTAGICVNEGYDPDVMEDVGRALERLVPWKGDYRHAEGNAAAHVKTMLVGSSVSIRVRSGDLALGRWQEIFLCEFDGPRERTVVLTFLPG